MLSLSKMRVLSFLFYSRVIIKDIKGHVKMKIGLFTDTYYPQVNGVATSVQILKKNLEILGHEVYLFTTTDPKSVKEEAHVYRVASIPFVSSRRVGMFYHLGLAKFIRELGLDLIHTHTEFSLGIFGRTMAKELNIPLLHTYHTIYEQYTHYIINMSVLESIAKSTARKISAHFCNSVDRVVVPTDKVKDLLVSYGVNKDISIIPTGIEFNKFSKHNYNSDTILKLRSDLGIGANDKVILYIGRISEEKSIDEILIAMKSFFKGRPDAKFLLVGDGPSKDNLEDMAKKLGIYGQTIFAGEKSFNEIDQYYQLGDVFVSASQSETQGITYIEAVASGIPVVAKTDRCLDGVIQNGINGYTYQSMAEFSSYLDSILNDNQEKSRWSIEGIKSIERFTATNFAATILAEYKNMITNQKDYENVS